MISARDFYKLQKLERQGKLADNPNASTLVAKVTETLLTSQRSSPNLARAVPATAFDASALSGSSNTDIRPKKSRKRKRKSKAEVNKGTTGPLNRFAPVVKSNETDEAVPNDTHQPNRSQRKRLRKKRRKTPTVEIDGLQAPKLSMSVPFTKEASKAAPLRSPILPSVSSISNEPPCLSEPHKTVPTQATVLVADKRSPTKLESGKDTSKHDHSTQSPIDMGRKELEHIIAPLSIDEFFRKYFEKHPLFLQRKTGNTGWLCTQDLDTMLLEERVMFTEHLDVASYRNGQRLTLNPSGRAFRSVVWDLYNSGCSLRLLCPQLFLKNIRYRLSLLHEYFGCFVGCNVYLTPPGSQGFAPHYDDIEAFILQLEGSKRWRVYAPRDASEKLPREPSPNFTQDEIGEPILTALLTPGDVLYLPRGYIHQAETNNDAHSLHITISTYQKHTWGDFMEKLLPVALQTAMETSVAFREGLPIGILQHVGGFVIPQHSSESKALKEFRREVVSRVRQLADLIERSDNVSDSEKNGGFPDAVDPLLSAADLFAVDLIGQALPPQLHEGELACHVLKQGEQWKSMEAGGEGVPSGSPGVANAVVLRPDTKLRLVRWSALRAVRTRIAPQHSDVEEDELSSCANSTTSATGLGGSGNAIAVYHSLSNTNVFKERDLDEMMLDAELLPALDHLARVFPNFVSVDSLPLSNPDDQLRVAVGLYEAGLLVTSTPLPIIQDEADSETTSLSLECRERSTNEHFLNDSVDLDNYMTSSEREKGSEDCFILSEYSDSSETSSGDGNIPVKRHTGDGKRKRRH